MLLALTHASVLYPTLCLPILFYLEEYVLLYVAANYMPFQQVTFW